MSYLTTPNEYKFTVINRTQDHSWNTTVHYLPPIGEIFEWDSEEYKILSINSDLKIVTVEQVS
jgi:hypothetical protein